MSDFDADRHPLDVLAEEFAARHRRGERPSIAEYVRQYPDLAEEIRSLFPSVLLLEQFTEQKQGQSSGRRMAASFPGLERLGDYHILREISRGGMGVVYLARQESLGRYVALKLLSSSSASETHRQRFEREARAAAQLHHTNIVPVFGVGREDELSYYVMQYIDGQSLSQVLGRLKQAAAHGAPDADRALSPKDKTSHTSIDTLPLVDQPTDGAGETVASSASLEHVPQEASGAGYYRWVAEIGLQTAEALEYAHLQGVIHRDIKPANLLLDRQGKVWITDFGVARLADDNDLTAVGDVVGTLRYMAPEQLNGEAEPRSDVYSLGLTLYELLALRPAFEETSRGRLVQRLSEGTIPRLRAVRPEIPRDLETIVSKAIAHEPKDRYPSTAALAHDLRCWLEDRPILARRISAAERLWRWCRRNRVIAALAAVALCSLITATTVGWIGYLRTGAALEEARAATSRAETNLELSLRAFETIFDQIAGRDSVQPLSDDPEVELLLPAVPSEHDLRLLEQLLQFYEQFAKQNQSNQRLRAETARAYRRVGEIQQKFGRLEEADEAFQRALAIYGDLQRREKNKDYAIDLAAVYNSLGISLQLSHHDEQARQAHEKALELLGGEDSDRSRLEQIRTHNALGQLLAMRPLRRPHWRGSHPDARRAPRIGTGEPESDAETHLQQALELAQSLVARDSKNPDYRLALARSYEQLALARQPHRQTEQTMAANRAAIELLKQLATEFPSVALYRQELAEAYLLSNGPSRLLLSSSDIRPRIEEARRLAEQLHAEYPQVPEYTRLLAQTTSKYGDFLARDGLVDEALREYRRSADLLQSLVDSSPSSPWFGYLLASNRQMLGDYLRKNKRWQESREELEKAIATTESLVRSSSQLPRGAAQFFLAKQYSSLAASLEQMGETKLAEAAQAKARSLRPAPGPRPERAIRGLPRSRPRNDQGR